MKSKSVTPSMKKFLDELEGKPGTQEELAKRLGLQPRTIRDIIKSWKVLQTDIPYILKSSHRQKVYYLKKKPVIIEKIKENETEKRIKFILSEAPSNVYELSKKWTYPC